MAILNQKARRCAGIIVVSLCTVVSGFAYADNLTSFYEFLFQGQREENTQLVNQQSETRYRSEDVPDTCNRQIPYTENVCRMVTRSREECHTEPGYEDCRMQDEQQCRDVIRYRQECMPGPVRRVCYPGQDQQVCQPGPGRQVCERTPDRQECRPGPSQQDCHMGPPRQECSTGPGRQECHTTPSRQECTTGPSRQECHPGPARQDCRPGPSTQVCSPARTEQRCEDRRVPVCEVVAGRRICRQETQRVCENVSVPGECRNVPGPQVCRTVPGEQICRTVPGQQMCRTIPGQQVCSNIPGERICRNVPGERICRTIPGQPICHTIPGQNVCHQVPGPNICRTVPGPQVCRDEQGAPVCRQVAYNDRECQNVPRRICQWIPPRPVCTQIPYEERVCQDETRYRNEPYACTRTIQVPYSVVVKRYEAKVAVQFEAARDQSAKANFKVDLSDRGELDLAAKTMSPEHLWVATRQLARTTQGEVDSIEALFHVDVLPMAILSAVSTPINEVKVRKSYLSFTIGQVTRPDLLRLHLKIERKGRVALDKILNANDLQLSPDGATTLVKINTEKLGFTFAWAHAYIISVDLRVEFTGKVLNNPVPPTKQEFIIKKTRLL